MGEGAGLGQRDRGRADDFGGVGAGEEGVRLWAIQVPLESFLISHMEK